MQNTTTIDSLHNFRIKHNIDDYIEQCVPDTFDTSYSSFSTLGDEMLLVDDFRICSPVSKHSLWTMLVPLLVQKSVYFRGYVLHLKSICAF